MATLDEVVDILAQTVFSVKGATGLALATIMRPEFRPYQAVMLLWLALVVAIRLAGYVDRRLAASKWPPLAAGDVVVVTGASSGLGLLVAGILSERGVKVAAVDVAPLPIPLAHATHFATDVSDDRAVASMAAEVLAIGTPRAVVNCAGVLLSGPLHELAPAAIRKMVDVNFLGAVWVTRAFLPAMLGGRPSQVVSVASSTALAAPARVGVYAATKAALRSVGEALRYELQGTNVRALTVTPGQLDTAMFRHVPPPAPFLAPVVRGVDLAVAMVAALDAGREGELRLPTYALLLPLAQLLPQRLVDWARRYAGIDSAIA